MRLKLQEERNKMKFQAKMKFFCVACFSVLTVAAIFFGLYVAAQPSQAQSALAESNKVVNASGVYSLATQADYNGMSVGTCALCGSTACKLITNERELASVFKFGNTSGGLSSCYKVVYQGETDTVDWASQGMPRSLPQLGLSEESAFGGCFDFGGLTLRTESNLDNNSTGLFPFATLANIANLKVIHSGFGAFLGGTFRGCTVSGISAQIYQEGAQPAECTASVLVNEFGKNIEPYVVGRFEDSDFTIYPKNAVYNVYAPIGATTGTLSRISVRYLAGNMSMSNFGGLAYRSAGNSKGETPVQKDCTVTFESGGVNTVAGNAWGGILCGKENSQPVRIENCTVRLDVGNANIAMSQVSNPYPYVGYGYGGIVGLLPAASAQTDITGCKVSALNFCNANGYIGGIVGGCNTPYLTVSDCVVNLDTVTGYQYAGGIVGYFGLSAAAANAVTIERCDITFSYMHVMMEAGGIGGFCQMNISLIDCNVRTGVLQASRPPSGMASYLGMALGHTESNSCPQKIQSIAIQGGTYYGKSFKDLTSGRGVNNLVGMIYHTPTVKIATEKAVTYMPVGGNDVMEDTSNNTSGDSFTKYECNATLLSGDALVQADAELDAALDNAGNDIWNNDVIVSRSQENTAIEVRLCGKTHIDCKIKSLYVSVSGRGDDRYTQLIYNGEVIGNMGNVSGALKIGDKNIPWGTELIFSYPANPVSIKQVRFIVELQNDAGEIFTLWL